MSAILRSDFPDIIFIEDVACVSQHDLIRLPEYSTSLPTGMYPGKVWKRRGVGDRWLLAETVESEKPGYVDILWRDIKVTAPPARAR